MLLRCGYVIYKATVMLSLGAGKFCVFNKNGCFEWWRWETWPAASFSRELSWASGEQLGSTGRWSYYPCFFSPQWQACQPVITGYQHPLFWSWDSYVNNMIKHGLPRLPFGDLKFPFGRHGIQIKPGTWMRGRMQLSAEKLDAGLKDPRPRNGPQ